MSSRMSGLYWLDGQQAAKFEVLYHWEFLQTLEGIKDTKLSEK